MKDRDYYLGFSMFSGIGPIKFEALLKHFGSAKSAWEAPISTLKPIIGSSLSPKFEDFRKSFSIDGHLNEFAKKKIRFIVQSDTNYPKRLLKIKKAPIVLFVKGEIDFNSDQKLIAVVGTRKMTAYGKSVTDLFAGELAQAGIVIVSGLALGVDGAAHMAAMDSGGKTIAVLGSGVDNCYPSSNQRIYDKILAGNGAIISELPPGMPPSVGSFPARNRIAAGISDGVLVTEGASDSGSLITANFGLEFGKKVFAVPGPITSSLSAAPLRLIEKGAKLVITPSDVIKELGISSFAKTSADRQNFKALSPEEKKIVELLENESLHFDEIVRQLKIDSSKVGSILSLMEIKGLVKNSNGNYSLC